MDIISNDSFTFGAVLPKYSQLQPKPFPCLGPYIDKFDAGIKHIRPFLLASAFFTTTPPYRRILLADDRPPGLIPSLRLEIVPDRPLSLHIFRRRLCSPS